MPWLEEALDPARASMVLRWSLPSLGDGWLGDGPLEVRRAEVMARKPGRRALVDYHLVQSVGHRRSRSVRLVGKTRARGLDVHTYRLHLELVALGLHSGSPDGISVPTPVGVVGEWRMWLQEFVPGESLASSLPGPSQPEGVALMQRLAGALHRLHAADAPATRIHTMDDELRILDARLKGACGSRPDLAPAIERVGEGCRRLAGRVASHRVRGIHRDFHPGQVILDGPRLVLLDLDLYAEGDPALDIGNFTAHLTELAIRGLGSPHGFRELEEAFQEEALRLDPNLDIGALEDWHTLSLARHIGLSTTLPGRSMTTGLLIDHVSQRLATAGALPVASSVPAGAPMPPGTRMPAGTVLAETPQVRDTPQVPPTPVPGATPALAVPPTLAPGAAPGLAVPPQPAVPRGTHPSMLMLLALAGFLPAASPVAGQTQHQFTGGVEVSSVYDSNIDRERVNPRGLAGVVTSGILRYRMRGDYDLRGEYEIGFHRYAEDTPWNRVSHKLRADGRMELGRDGTLGLVTELQIRGSGEERSLGDQLQIQPSYRHEFGTGTEAKIFGTARIRRDQGPGEGEWNAFGGLEVVQELGPVTELELGGRFERNQSPSGRRTFQGPRGYLELTRQFAGGDEVMVGVEVRDRRYLERLIETRDGDDALRHDSRLTPVLRWERKFRGGVLLSLDFEYEQRMSNDRDKAFGGYTILFGASRFW